ncbi:interferon alpha-inducible protein 27-like protein 2A [Physella acuta]|uniref:interferon alpha-inducible protein 27-like protein 2A n=1 Tax=Physella acuta TaxID=109671 RepID=UPI0027DC0152|nr:interferon alpha-inducible protein 27-like protein 2A [Physella acuta]
MQHRPSNSGGKKPDSGPKKRPPSIEQRGWSWRTIASVAVTAVGAVALAPVAVAAAGFGAGGIAAGSLAASMMSTAATSGVGMGVVSVLQSVGAVGFGLAGNAGLAAGGAAVGGVVARAAKAIFGQGDQPTKEDDENDDSSDDTGHGETKKRK